MRNEQIKLSEIAVTVAEIFDYKTSPMEMSLFDKFLCHSYCKFDHKFFTRKKLWEMRNEQIKLSEIAVTVAEIFDYKTLPM